MFPDALNGPSLLEIESSVDLVREQSVVRESGSQLAGRQPRVGLPQILFVLVQGTPHRDHFPDLHAGARQNRPAASDAIGKADAWHFSHPDGFVEEFDNAGGPFSNAAEGELPL